MRFSPLLILASLALAAPHLEKRLDLASRCGQWDTITAGIYILYLDLWGQRDAASGSQCSHLTSLSNDGLIVAWTTTWTWAGGIHVKSFSSIATDVGLNKQLSAINTIATTWTWSQSTTSGIVADVAYDLFTSATPGGAHAHEIMIWLANYNNARPISYTYSSSGIPAPIASTLSLGGHTWNLYYGSNGAHDVFSFVPTSGAITRFSADLKPFFTYLITHKGLPSSQYLVTAQAGTEPTSGGPVTLTTSAYKLVIT